MIWVPIKSLCHNILLWKDDVYRDRSQKHRSWGYFAPYGLYWNLQRSCQAKNLTMSFMIKKVKHHLKTAMHIIFAVAARSTISLQQTIMLSGWQWIQSSSRWAWTLQSVRWYLAILLKPMNVIILWQIAGCWRTWKQFSRALKNPKPKRLRQHKKTTGRGFSPSGLTCSRRESNP